MMRVIARIAMLILAMAGLAATAQTPAFDPPLDEQLSYEVVQVRSGQGKPQRISSTDHLRFSRKDQGYELEWRSTQPKVEAEPPMDAMLRAIVQAAVEQPMVLKLTGEGEIDGVANLAVWRAKRAELLELAFSGLPNGPGSAALQPLIVSMKKGLSAQSDEQLVQELTDMPSYLTLGAVAPLAAGEELTADTELPSAIGSGSLPAKLTMKGLADTANGHGRMSLTTVPDPAAMTRMVGAMLETLLKGMPEGARAAARSELQRAQFVVRETAEIEFDRRTGLSLSVVKTKNLSWGKAMAREERMELKAVR